MKYEDGHVSFEPPGAMGAATMVAYSAPDRGAISVTHARLNGERNVPAFVKRYLKELRESAPGLRVLSMRDREIGGRSAGQLDVALNKDIEQTVIFVEPGPEGEPFMTLFVFTAKPGTSRSAFEGMLESVSFAKPAPPPSVQPPQSTPLTQAPQTPAPPMLSYPMSSAPPPPPPYVPPVPAFDYMPNIPMPGSRS